MGIIALCEANFVIVKRCMLCYFLFPFFLFSYLLSFHLLIVVSSSLFLFIVFFLPSSFPLSCPSIVLFLPSSFLLSCPSSFSFFPCPSFCHVHCLPSSLFLPFVMSFIVFPSSLFLPLSCPSLCFPSSLVSIFCHVLPLICLAVLIGIMVGSGSSVQLLVLEANEVNGDGMVAGPLLCIILLKDY